MSNENQREDSNLQNIYDSYVVPNSQHSVDDAVTSAKSAGLEVSQSISSHSDTENMGSLLKLSQKLEDKLNQVCTLQRKLIQEEILVWKREQQLARNGWNRFTKNLSDIQNSCDEFLDSHLELHNDLELLYQKEQRQTKAYHDLKSRAVALLGEFLNATLVVESQSSQVTYKRSRLMFQVRHLLGHKLHSQSHNKSVMTATLINESTARELAQTRHENRNGNPPSSSGIVLNGSTKMEIADGNYLGNFENLQVRKIERISSVKNSSMRKATPEEIDWDTDEKFCVYFQTEIQCCSRDFNVWTLSYPILVLYNPIRFTRAQGFIFWDNAFGCVKDPTDCLLDRIPFQVLLKVSWESLAEMLSAKFEKATGKGFDSVQLEALKHRLLPEAHENTDSASTSQETSQSSAIHDVSFNQFVKSKLSGGSFSFWEWFFNLLELVERYASLEWRSGAIHAFISRMDAENMLQGSSPGVFLVRFSDSKQSGGISITYVNEDGNVYSIAPWTHVCLSCRSLLDRIWDRKDLTHVYPDAPKSEIFPHKIEAGVPKPFPPTIRTFMDYRNDLEKLNVAD